MEDLTEIYVTLPDEEDETLICQPVQARHLRGNLYRIVGENPDPENERWEFSTGDAVRCKRSKFVDGQIHMLAYAKVEE
ncbi:MAG TPA: hypothetical protein VGC89_05240, partial [Pyrinomonadaceae bacterium]